VRLDLDRLDEVACSSALFSHNRFNVLSFNDADHGRHDGSDLRTFVDGQLAEHDIDCRDGRIELVAMPRVFGYAFHPVSFYYCYSSDNYLRAVLVEVHNTFGEHHFYVLHESGHLLSEPVTCNKAKQFHVSPFLDRRGEYTFCLRRPSDQLAIGIRLYQDNELKIATVLSGEARSLDSLAIAGAALAIPLMTFKVTAAIYWQGLKLWLRGAGLRHKPTQKLNKVS